MADVARLMVPVTLDVLVVNNRLATSDAPWSRWTPQYANVAAWAPPNPDPFHESDTPAVGAHLHWALPDALTHGVQTSPDADDITYPNVPNRWLVARIVPGDAGKNKAWLIESDYADPNDGTSPYLNASVNGLTPANVQALATRIGRISVVGALAASDLAALVAAPPGSAPFLTAIGPGEATFAAFAPLVDNVFGMYDDLAELGDLTVADALLTYAVFGWFAHPDADPLAGVATYVTGGPWVTPDRALADARQCWESETPAERFQLLLEQYRWSVETAPDDPPSASIFHAMNHSVHFQNARLPLRPNGGPDDWVQLEVAIGNTAIDGVAGLIEARAAAANEGDAGALVAELFEAVQYDALDLVDDRADWQQLDRRIRQAWFGSQPGGTVWRIVDAASVNRTRPSAPPPTTPEQAAWLDDLNARQHTYDLAVRALEAAQRDLFGLWWKAGWSSNPFNHPPPNVISSDDWTQLEQALASALPAAAANVRTTQLDLARLAATVPSDPTDQGSIDAWVTQNPPPYGLPSGRALKGNAMPRFWQANDPVVVVSGLRRSSKHGEDGRETEDGTLVCRLPGTTITGITSGGKHISTANVAAADIPDPWAGQSTPDLSALFTEVFFLDPANAATMAAAIGRGADPAFVTGLGQAIAGLDDLDGRAPSPIGLERWQQGWSPLYLEWQVSYVPTYSPATTTIGSDEWSIWRFAFDEWEFDGTEYIWTGGALPSGSLQNTYQGRTFLTPHAGFNFTDRISKYLKAHPDIDIAQVDALLATVGDPDVLSQTLSGFTTQLAMWRNEQTIRPFGSVDLPGGPATWASLIGNQNESTPDLSRSWTSPTWQQQPPPYIFPIRAGFLSFSALSVVDCFGQRVDLMYANGNAGHDANQRRQTFEPRLGRGMTPNGPITGLTHHNFAMLPPRLTAPARLDFTLTPVAHGTDAATTVPTTAPKTHAAFATSPPGPSSAGDGLCGWLIPNHLDGGVSVYDAQGSPLGELIAVPVDVGALVDWLPAPGPDPIAIEDIPNQHLRAVLTSFPPDSTTAGASFQAFLAAIDSTLASVDPLGGRADQNLSMLIGRPLALVRAELQLVLYGHPVDDQSLDLTRGVPGDGTNAALQSRGLLTSFFASVDFPIRLGDESLPDDGLIGYYLDDAYSVFHSIRADPPADAYIEKIGVGNFIQLPFDGATKAELTMLVDPRAKVHAFSGILPVKDVALPGVILESFLDTLQVTFRTGPLLTDPETIRIPAPAESNGTWSWLHQTEAVTAGRWADDKVLPLGEVARLPDDPAIIQEGWLKLQPHAATNDQNADAASP